MRTFTENKCKYWEICLLFLLFIGFGDNIKWVSYENGLKEIKNRLVASLTKVSNIYKPVS